MKKNDKQRLFEVMTRLDKTFKPKLNEEFEEIEATDTEVSPEMSAEVPVEKEKTPEEKYEELKAKVEELYAMIHGDGESEENAENGEEEIESEKEPEMEIDEAKKPKVPVAAIPKVGK